MIKCTIVVKIQGVPKNIGIQSLLWIKIVIPNFKSHNISMPAKVYFMKRVNGCKDVSIMSLKMNIEDGPVYCVCIL